MKKCFDSMYLMNTIARYIKYEDIFNFSLTNKSMHYLSNEEKNPYINSLFRDFVLRKYYNIHNISRQFYNENVKYDDYKISKNNWKNIFKDLYINYQIFLDKEINEFIYNNFKNHYYFPYQRKENAILEYENSTFHQIICYDIKMKDLIEKNYYDKFFKKSNINDENSNKKIEPLRKGLFFEEELANFQLEIDTYKENKNIVKMIIDYAYEELDKLFSSNISFDINLDRDGERDKKEYKNKNKRKFNLIYFFLIWLNHTFILFTNLVCNYVIQFKESGSAKQIISAYSKTHSNLINFGLLINEKLNNVNIIINYIKDESESPKIEHPKKFSIYGMMLNIMQKNFYQKLKPILNQNIEKMIKNFNEDILQKKKINISFDSNNIETSNSEILNDENNADDDNYDLYLNDSGEENYSLEEDNDLNDEDNNMTDQEVIEQYYNLILDFSINGENSSYINHSKIILNQIFNEQENLMINIFLDNLGKKLVINEEKEYLNENYLFEEEVEILNDLFSLLKKYSKSDSNKNGNMKLINRTKLNIFKSSEGIVFNYLEQINNKKFIFELRNEEKGNKEINENTKNTVNNISVNNLNLSDKKYYNKTENSFFINKLNEIKNNLINCNLNMIEIRKEKIEELADRYINNNENKLMMITKDIIYLYNSQYNLFSHQDIKILDELFKDKNNKHDKLFNHYFQN